jgi:hypothetical protein
MASAYEDDTHIVFACDVSGAWLRVETDLAIFEQAATEGLQWQVRRTVAESQTKLPNPKLARRKRRKPQYREAAESAPM